MTLWIAQVSIYFCLLYCVSYQLITSKVITNAVLTASWYCCHVLVSCWFCVVINLVMVQDKVWSSSLGNGGKQHFSGKLLVCVPNWLSSSSSSIKSKNQWHIPLWPWSLDLTESHLFGLPIVSGHCSILESW